MSQQHERAVALIREGARLHYERDDDEALLRGDQLYAEGLVLLAASGDLAAVARLADAIAQVAQRAASDSRRDVDDSLLAPLN